MIRKVNSDKTAQERRAAVTKTTGAKRPPAVRDNVLGRRSSKSDPLGEQPGTVSHNQEQLGGNAPGPEPPAPVRKRK